MRVLNTLIWTLNTFLSPDRLNPITLICTFRIFGLYAERLNLCRKRLNLNASLLNLSLDAWICMLYDRIRKYCCGHLNHLWQLAIDLFNYRSSLSRCHRLLGYVKAPKAGCYNLNSVKMSQRRGVVFRPTIVARN